MSTKTKNIFENSNHSKRLIGLCSSDQLKDEDVEFIFKNLFVEKSISQFSFLERRSLELLCSSGIGVSALISRYESITI